MLLGASSVRPGISILASVRAIVGCALSCASFAVGQSAEGGPGTQRDRSTIVSRSAEPTMTLPASVRSAVEELALARETPLLDKRTELPAEGSYLTGFVGRVVRATSGGLVFVPEDAGPKPVKSGEAGKAKDGRPPMLKPDEPWLWCACELVPSDRVESILAGRDESDVVMMSGVALRYHGRLFIYDARFVASHELPKDRSPSALTSDADDTLRGDLSGPRENIAPSAGLEAEFAKPRLLDPRSAARADEPRAGLESAAASAAPLAAITVRGRFRRSARHDGRMLFEQDNDPDSPAEFGPLVVLPSGELERMERMVMGGDDRAFDTVARVVDCGAIGSALLILWTQPARPMPTLTTGQ